MATVASHSDIAQFVPEYSAQFMGELQGILEKAQRFSGATGAAIAFVEGEELVTKSSLGVSAPEVGSHSPIVGSFAGLCIQTREVQRCDDASCDSRVDSQACAALGVASMVMVPIGEKNKMLGVLAAFAPKPNAFTPTHVALLRTLADIVVELYNRYPSPRPASQAPEANAPVPKSEALKPAAPVVVEKSEPVSAKPSPQVIAAVPSEPEPLKPVQVPKMKSVTVAPNGIKITEAPVIVPPVGPEPAYQAGTSERSTYSQSVVRTERKPESVKIAPVIDIVAGREKREEVLSAAADIGPVNVAKAAEPQLFANYGYSAIGALEQQEQQEKGSKRALLFAVALILLAALAAGGYTFWHRSSKPVVAEAASVQPAPVAASVPVEPTPAPTVTESQNLPPQTHEPVATSSVTVPDHTAKLTASTATAKEKSEPPAEKAPILVANSNNVPRRPAAESVDAPSVVPAATGDVSKILGMVKTAQPQANFRASEITPPELSRRVSPLYPSMARQWHLKSEQVVLNATIGKDGNVTNVKAVKGRQIFVDAGIYAVRQWKYKPAYLNGEAVPATVEIVLDFTN